MDSLNFQPIGIIHTQMKVKFDTPHQPENDISEQNVIELYPDNDYELALRDLIGFERIWIIWWFHKNTNWRPLVTPPRGPEKRRGVFATRSPHRPCPIGITSVPLISIDGRKITVGNTDLLDQTPILDIKPYISKIDSFPDQRQGWLVDVEKELLEPSKFTVSLSPVAELQASWLKENWQIDFLTKSIKILERAPKKSRTNRISNYHDNSFRLSTGGWRVFFSVEGLQVRINRLAPGYPPTLLITPGYEVIPDWEAQIEFNKTWPPIDFL